MYQDRAWTETGHVAETREWQGERGRMKPERSARAMSDPSAWDMIGSDFILRMWGNHPKYPSKEVGQYNSGKKGGLGAPLLTYYFIFKCSCWLKFLLHCQKTKHLCSLGHFARPCVRELLTVNRIGIWKMLRSRCLRWEISSFFWKGKDRMGPGREPA